MGDVTTLLVWYIPLSLSLSLSLSLCSDLTKRQSTLKKLAGLWRQLGDSGQVVHTYSTLLETYGGAGKEGGGQSSGGEAEEVAELWRQLTSYLLEERSLSESAWAMVRVLTQSECTCYVRAPLFIRWLETLALPCLVLPNSTHNH